MKFNQKTKGTNIITNHPGERAYKVSPELELYSAVVTSSLSNTFYESSGKRIERIRTLVGKNKPEFVAKLAVYTREKMYLRSVPLVLAVELARVHQGDNLVSRMVSKKLF